MRVISYKSEEKQLKYAILCIMLGANLYPAKSESARWIERGEEVIVLNPKRRVYHHLNCTASRVWQLCDGAWNVKEIAELIEECFETKGFNPGRDVSAMVGFLKKSGLVELRRGKCLSGHARRFN